MTSFASTLLPSHKPPRQPSSSGRPILVEPPLILAGPVLRRTEAHRVNVWVATTRPVLAKGRVVEPRTEEELGSGSARSVQLGSRLFVHLVGMEPHRGRFPEDTILAYDVDLSVAESRHARRASEPARGPATIAYPGYGLPTFLIAKEAPTHALHGSCRLLHGGGNDALAAADAVVEGAAGDPRGRPTTLFLTGDQIYADDVATAMIVHLRPLAGWLAGPHDATSVPNLPDLRSVAPDGRADMLRAATGFTSDKASNHLASFGEFAAMYAMAWNEQVWPPMFPPASTVLGKRRDAAAHPAGVRRYRHQVSNLERARLGLRSVRRVLANTPTYMIFDDHDVTDDWNLTRDWRDAIAESPAGRRIVANALAAFWAFQGWGNDPELYDDGFIRVIRDHLGNPDSEGSDFDDLLWSFDRWSFMAPGRPHSVVLDTRTQRSYDSGEGASRLLGRAARERVAGLVRGAGHRPGDPLLVVSAVPVFGVELHERRQKYLVDRVGPYEIDFEAWHSNLHGMVELMELVVAELQPSFCILLSGDVHYGVNARAAFTIGAAAGHFTQLVSSGQKHAGRASSAAINLLGHFLRPRHERLGWRTPPRGTRSPWVLSRAPGRAANTDEWDQDAPVFLSPLDVRLLQPQSDPDYRECRVYVRPRPGSSVLVGENNVGLLHLERDMVTHQLISPDRSGSPRVATIDPVAPV